MTIEIMHEELKVSKLTQTNKKPAILLIGPKNDSQLKAIAAHINNSHFQIVHINSRVAMQLVVDLEKPELSTIKSVAIKRVRGAFIRSIPPRNQVLAHSLQKKIAAKDYWAGQMEADARRDTLCTLLTFLNFQPQTNVLNAPQNGVVHTHKPLQLMRAKSSGLKIPHTIITSDILEAKEFIEHWTEAVVKPVRGGAPASLIRANDPRLTSLTRSPVILQERVHGPDIRVFMLDGKIISAARICGISGQYVDFRKDPNYQKGQAVYEEVKIEKSIEKSLADLQKREKKRFSGIDLKENDKGFIFLESNSAPIYLEQERALGHQISRKIAQALTKIL